MGKEEKRKQYLVSQALQVKKTLSQMTAPSFSVDGYRGFAGPEPILQNLWLRHQTQIRRLLRQLEDEHLGKIVLASPSPFSGDGHEIWTHYTVADMAVEIAAQGIASAIAGLVWDEVRKPASEKLAEVGLATHFSRMYEEGERFMAHCRQGVGGHWYFQSISSSDLKLTVGCMFSLSPDEIKKKSALLAEKGKSWVPAEKEVTIVLEVVQESGRPVKGPVLYTETFGPTADVVGHIDYDAMQR